MADTGTGTSPREEESSGNLKRAVSTPLLLCFVVGNIVGAGIYVAPGEVAASVGSAIWLPFLIAFIVAILTAFSYSELVSKYPKAGGAALFVNRAYGLPFFSFLVAFTVMASGLSSSSGISRTFGGDYLGALTGLPVSEGAGNIITAILFILVLALINYFGISGSAKINAVLTVLSLVGLLLIVLVGVVAIFYGEVDFGRPFTFEIPDGSLFGLALLGGAVTAFYALIGFEDSANIAEETRDASRVYPRALFLGLVTTGILYLAVCFVVALVVPTGNLVGSSGPLLEVVEAGRIPIPPALFSVAALVGITNTALINLIIASRVIYGMGQEGVLPSIFGSVDRRRQTPLVAIIFTTIIALVLSLTGDFGDLSSTTVLLILAVFAVVNITTLVLRRDTVEHSHFTAPSVIPVIGSISCVVLLIQQDAGTWVRAIVLIAIGLALYGINILLKRRESSQSEQGE